MKLSDHLATLTKHFYNNDGSTAIKNAKNGVLKSDQVYNKLGCSASDFAYAKTKVQISCAVTAQLISAFVFATWIVQFHLRLNPKFQASNLLP